MEIYAAHSAVLHSKIVPPSVDSPLFKVAERDFGLGIVETFTSTAHAADKAMYFQKPPVLHCKLIFTELFLRLF